MQMTTLTDFIRALFPSDGSGLIEFRALPSVERGFFRRDDLAQIMRFLRTHDGKDLYFGIASRKSPGDGSLANCTELTALFVDLDFKTTPEIEARARLETFLLRPSIIVKSGGGLHVYWLLKEALELQTEAASARSLLRRLALALGGDLSAAEPARILRVPGTLNHKYAPPRPVIIEAFNPERAYNPSDFDDVLPEESEQTKNDNGHRFNLPDEIAEGDPGRDNMLYRFGRKLKCAGLTEGEITDALLAANRARCKPKPLPEAHVREKAHHVATQPDRPDFTQNDIHDGSEEQTNIDERLTTQLADIKPEDIKWLWPFRIARGKLTMLIGDPELGKSLLTLDLAARITNRLPFPDGSPGLQGDAILLSAEDGVADTVRPRFDAAGGDPTRVHVLNAMRDRTGERLFDLGRDLPRLERAITQTQAALVIVDPISAYLSAKTDSYRDAEVRRVLAPLAALANRTSAAVVAIMHLTKNQQTRAIYRAQGSIAFAAAARAVFAVAEDRADKERRLFVCVKMNIAKKPPALRYKIEAPEGQPITVWEAGSVEPTLIRFLVQMRQRRSAASAMRQ